MKTIELNFLGKDSVPYKGTIEIDDLAYDIIKQLKSQKKDNDQIFDVGSGEVSEFIKQFDKNISPKMIRTCYGGKILSEELKKHPINDSMSESEKKAVYNNAALEVTKKLNHHKNVAKNFDEQLDKQKDKLKNAKTNAKEKQIKIEEQLKKIDEQIMKAKNKYKGKELKEKLAVLKEKKEKAKISLEKSKEKINKEKINLEFKNATKDYAIGTAKGAYSDPRIAYSWCKDADIDISFIYSKSLAEKFSWAADTPADYWRNYPNV